MENVMSASSFKFMLYVTVALVCYLLFRAGRRTATDDHTFGGYNIAFACVFGLLILALSRVWIIPQFIDAIEEGVSFMAEKVEEKTSGVPQPGTSGVGLPTGVPADYVEWVDHAHLQPKAGAPVLPTGWRVAVTDDPTKPGIVVDKPIDVSYDDVWVYFDPDTTVVKGKTALPAIKLIITRP